MKTLAVIPARGGSKGVPRKNLASVGDRPLVAWTITQAVSARRLTDVVLSTDDQEIADVGIRYGAEVPFLRPSHLAGDSSPTIDVVIDLCQQLMVAGRTYDAICLLQPTSPERGTQLIDQCIDKLDRSTADSLVTVSAVPHQYNPHWVYFKDPKDGLMLSTGGVEPIPQRQLLPPAYIRDGRIYLTRTDVIMKQNSLYGRSVLGVQLRPGVNIDTPDDLEELRQKVDQWGGLVSDVEIDPSHQ